MERIEEEGPKTLKDASVSELLDEAEKKLGLAALHDTSAAAVSTPAVAHITTERQLGVSREN